MVIVSVMQLDEDPLSFLDRSYSEVRGVVGRLASASVFEDQDEGEPDELYAEASDGRWQCRIDAEGNIETIFLFPEKGSTAVEGQPAKSGQKRSVRKPLLFG